MRVALTSSLIAIVLTGASPIRVSAQTGQCLHQAGETFSEQQRRTDAVRAIQLIGGLASRSVVPRQEAYPEWEEVARRGAAMGRMDGGPMGRLARRMDWSGREPLPGWQVHYVADRSGYSLSLRDLTDPCRLAYFSDESGMISEGQARDTAPLLRPLDTR